MIFSMDELKAPRGRDRKSLGRSPRLEDRNGDRGGKKYISSCTIPTSQKNFDRSSYHLRFNSLCGSSLFFYEIAFLGRCPRLVLSRAFGAFRYLTLIGFFCVCLFTLSSNAAETDSDKNFTQKLFQKIELSRPEFKNISQFLEKNQPQKACEELLNYYRTRFPEWQQHPVLQSDKRKSDVDRILQNLLVQIFLNPF